MSYLKQDSPDRLLKMKSQMSRRFKVVKKVVKVKVKTKKSSMMQRQETHKQSYMRGKSQMTMRPNLLRDGSTDQYLSTVKIPAQK